MLAWLNRKQTWIITAAVLTVGIAATLWLNWPSVKQAKGNNCTQCHQAKFYSFAHTDYTKGNCTECHKPHKNKSDANKATLLTSIPELCTKCHENQTKQLKDMVVHRPYKNGKCMSCHSPHGSDNMRMLREPPKDLCRSCHNQEGQTKRKDTHWPYISGNCVICHTGHSSNNAARLVSPQKQICKLCHPRIAGLDPLPVKMKPFAMGICTRCHNPHAADNQAQLQKPMPDLCADCHDYVWGLFNNGKPLTGSASRHDVPEGVLTCVNCHRPHASYFRKLLWRNFTQDSACGVCHQPHGSPTGKLLVEDNVIDVCLRCHKNTTYRTPYSHPVTNRLDPNAKVTLTCISTCHQGVYWPPEAFEKAFKGVICRMCHVGHFSADAGIGAATAKGTKLLWATLDELKERARWPERYAPFVLPKMGPRVKVNNSTKYPLQQYELSYEEVKPPFKVSVKGPDWKTRVERHLVNTLAKDLVGSYHRMPLESQFKIRSDRGCMLCHQITKLP